MNDRIRQIVVRETASDLFAPRRGIVCRTPAEAEQIVREAMNKEPMASPEKECFWVLHLNARNSLISCELVTVGIVDASLVHPREVFRGAIAANASLIIIAHNHPSGVTNPSAEDMRVTRQIIGAGKIIDIKVIDHIILGQGQSSFLSMRDSGLVDFGG